MKSQKQEIAEFCWSKIEKVKGKPFRSKFKSYVKNCGPLILNNGLIEALIFYKDKKEPKEKNKPTKDNQAYQELYNILNEYWMEYIPIGKNTVNSTNQDLFYSLIHECSTTQVLEISERILSVTTFLKRIANAEIEDEEEKK